MPEKPVQIRVVEDHVSFTREEIRLKLLQSVMNMAKAKKLTSEQIIAESDKLFNWITEKK